MGTRENTAVHAGTTLSCCLNQTVIKVSMKGATRNAFSTLLRDLTEGFGGVQISTSGGSCGRRQKRDFDKLLNVLAHAFSDKFGKDMLPSFDTTNRTKDRLDVFEGGVEIHMRKTIVVFGKRKKAMKCRKCERQGTPSNENMHTRMCVHACVHMHACTCAHTKLFDNGQDFGLPELLNVKSNCPQCTQGLLG